MKWLNHPKLLWSAFALLLFCLFLPSCYPPAYAKTYQMTETELTTLERHLETLAQNSKSKEESLQTLQKQLQTASERLQTLSTSNEKMQNSLKAAEESLRKYEAEAKRKAAIKDRQRNTWAAVAVGALLWACVK